MAKTMINANAFAELLKAGAPLNILDVRTPNEYFKERLAAPAVLQPHLALDISKLQEAFPDREQPLYLLCKAGVRADTAARKLVQEQAGFTSLVVIAGGLDALKRIPGTDIRHGADETPATSPPARPPAP